MEILQVSAAEETKESQYVHMMTVHQAKGLEYPYVFVVDMEEGVFPSSRIKTKAQFEEERRLAYVAFTRAEKRLYLSDHEAVDDQNNPSMMFSRFIYEADLNEMSLPVRITQSMRRQAEEQYRVNDARRQQQEPVPGAERINVGDRLSHRVFGPGVVTAKDDRGVIWFKPDGEELDYRFGDLSFFTNERERFIDVPDDDDTDFFDSEMDD